MQITIIHFCMYAAFQVKNSKVIDYVKDYTEIL